MSTTPIHTIDLNFQGRPLAIASYMIEHADGVVLVESGPGSTIQSLRDGLRSHGYELRDITHVLLTHIHLDHAGAAGELAAEGAQIFVHPVGAPHLLNPEKLLSSATRIYGDRMDTLWGKFLAVPAQKLTVLQNNDEISIGKLRFRAIDTPGHAEHHYIYCFEDMCFSGDVGAVRIPGYSYLRIPMPPPEFHLEKWRQSVEIMRKENFNRIAPTHFGLFDDVNWHLNSIVAALDEVEEWLNATMPTNLDVNELKQNFQTWMDAQARNQRLSDEVYQAYLLANPLGMSVDGILRYWKKFRNT